ncbi:MAG TPA: hypothetical protein VI455_02590 [Terriglobia bacterium]
MSLPKPFPEGSLEKLRAALKDARTKAEFQRVQCLWLRAALGLSGAQVATAIGWHPAAVARLQADYLRQGDAVLAGAGRGGRRRENLTRRAEQELLRKLRAEAAPSEVISSAAVHVAYEKAVGHPVGSSTVLRMLHRHGWTRHALVAMSAHSGSRRNAEGDAPKPRRGPLYQLRPDAEDAP